LQSNRIAVALCEEQIGYVQLDGACPLSKRKESLGKINTDPNIRVKLATIGAGGVGIDLTCTQRVYIMVSPSGLFFFLTKIE